VTATLCLSSEHDEGGRTDQSNAAPNATPVRLGANGNGVQFTSDPFYFVDPVSGQASLYFASLNRPGAPGDFDLFKSDLATACISPAIAPGDFGGDDLYVFRPLMPTIAQLCGGR
jgi:hypothetical protein